MTVQESIWVDLLDPDRAKLEASWPPGIHRSGAEAMLVPSAELRSLRPRLETRGDHILGAFVVPVVDEPRDIVYYQPVFLVLTAERMLTVRRTPVDGTAFQLSNVSAACHNSYAPSVGMFAFHLIDEIAEQFLHLLDDFVTEIDKLEDRVDALAPEEVRRRLSDLRHDLIFIRQTVSPTRDAVRSVVDNRIELDGTELFPRHIESHFSDAYDKLLRAFDGVELSRDLLSGVRDYHQAKIGNDQNDVMKRLTVVASMLLVPTLIVGVYGQNLKGGPEFGWEHGYWWSWGLIVGISILQLLLFRRVRWLGGRGLPSPRRRFEAARGSFHRHR